MCNCEGPEAYRETPRVARKAHRCCECGGGISTGQRYTLCSGVWDGHGDSFKICAACAELRDFVMGKVVESGDCGPCFTELLEWIQAGWPNPIELAFDENSARIVGRAAGLLCAREIAAAARDEQRHQALRKQQTEAACAS